MLAMRLSRLLNLRTVAENMNKSSIATFRNTIAFMT
jgi:hypothetical protein